MLLIYHFDKNDAESANFDNQEVRLDLGYFPDKNTHIRMRMIGWNNNGEGGTIHLDFPDLRPQYLEREAAELATDTSNFEGFMFNADEGSLVNNTKNQLAENGQGRLHRQSHNMDVDLHLGLMDHQKDFFRVIVRAPDLSGNLNNFSMVLEMHHGSNM